jgi:DNA invertase Pin-like site-specific DNA recombinase
VPPKTVRELRELTRRRKTLVRDRQREAGRLHKTLEDTGIKLDCVATDILGVSRLDRLGRSVLHLVTLGAELRDRGVGLHVIEQGIDTSTAEGRAMFGMLSVLAELQRELIVANTRDGLAAARARGRKGGRRPKLNAEQIALAQQLYDAGERTVQQIADIFKVPRTTLYGISRRPARASDPQSIARLRAPEEPSAAAGQRSTAK